MPLVKDMLNVVGENHKESDKRREAEKKFCLAKTDSANYWQENEFPDLHQVVSGRARRGQQAQGGAQGADLMELRAAHAASLLVNNIRDLTYAAGAAAKFTRVMPLPVYTKLNEKLDAVHKFRQRTANSWRPTRTTELNNAAWAIFDGTENACQAYLAATPDQSTLTLSVQQAAAQALADSLTAVRNLLPALESAVGAQGTNGDPNALATLVQTQRSSFMGLAAGMSTQLGVWKVGEGHIEDLKSGRSNIDMSRANYLTKAEFYGEFAEWLRGEVAKKHAREQGLRQTQQNI